MGTRAARILTVVACAFTAMGSANADTTYFFSNFNGLPDNTTVINGGSNSLTAYGLPNTYGLIRDDGLGGKALNIYGGEQYNGAASGAFAGLAARIASGETVLRMTGAYRTTPAYDNTPWNQSAQIQFQNSVGYFTYNSITVSASTPAWTPFQLDLDLSALDAGQLGQVQANFFIFEYNPGQFQVDDLTIKTVSPVPEPSATALGFMGAMGIVTRLIFRRRGVSPRR